MYKTNETAATANKLKSITSSKRYVNHDILTACDLRCLAPLNLATCSIQNIASSIGCTILSWKTADVSLALFKNFGSERISLIARVNVASVISLCCMNFPYPAASIRYALLVWLNFNSNEKGNFYHLDRFIVWSSNTKILPKLIPKKGNQQQWNAVIQRLSCSEHSTVADEQNHVRMGKHVVLWQPFADHYIWWDIGERFVLVFP